MNVHQILPASLLFVLATACGGGATKEAANPEGAPPEGSAESASEEEGTASDLDEGSSEPKAEEELAPSEPSEPSGPSGRSPKQILETEETRYVLSFSSSDVGLKAEESCQSKHSDNPQKRSDCLKTARSAVKEDVMVFKISETGKWVWITSNQRGSTLRPLKTVNFTWGAETKNSIAIEPSKGTTVVIGVPNNYSITIVDPKHGKMVYDTKSSDSER
jgi:hypothetical protein